MIKPNGIQAASEREREFHPTTKGGTLITAWQRRAATLIATVAEVNRLRVELDQMKEALRSRPF